MVRKKKKLPYREGTWFAVPLRQGGYAIGVAARIDGTGGMFGYFFGPKCEKVPILEEACKHCKEDAVLLTRFGDLGLIEGDWPIIGDCDEWDRGVWPMPPFVRIDEVAGKAWISHYSEDNLDFIQEKPCDPSLVSEYPYDRLSGSGAVEIRLTKILEGKAAS